MRVEKSQSNLLKTLGRVGMQTKTRNLFYTGSVLLIIALVIFFSLVVYATHVKVELDAKFEYAEKHGLVDGVWLFPTRYSVTVTTSLGNPSAFPVTVRGMSTRLTVNGVVLLGAKDSPEERYVIPAFGRQQWTETFYAFGDYADLLNSSETRQVLVDLRGYPSCMFYETLFQNTFEIIY